MGLVTETPDRNTGRLRLSKPLPCPAPPLRSSPCDPGSNRSAWGGRTLDGKSAFHSPVEDQATLQVVGSFLTHHCRLQLFRIALDNECQAFCSSVHSQFDRFPGQGIVRLWESARVAARANQAKSSSNLKVVMPRRSLGMLKISLHGFSFKHCVRFVATASFSSFSLTTLHPHRCSGSGLSEDQRPYDRRRWSGQVPDQKVS